MKEEITALQAQLQIASAGSENEVAFQEEAVLLRQEIDDLRTKLKKATAAATELGEAKITISNLETRLRNSESLSEKVKESDAVIRSMKGNLVTNGEIGVVTPNYPLHLLLSQFTYFVGEMDRYRSIEIT